MDTIKPLLVNPVVISAFVLLVIIVATRLGSTAHQRNRDIYFLIEIAFAVVILVLVSWSTIQTVEKDELHQARVRDLSSRLQAQTDRADQAEGQAAAIQNESQKELAKVKARTAWREVSEEQAHDFSTVLWTAPKGKVAVSYIADDPEAANYAVALSQMMRRAGYEAPDNLNGMIPLSPMGQQPIIGVKLSAQRQDNNAAGGLQQGLRRVGVDVRGRVNPAQTEDILIIVGRKSL